MLNPKEHLEEVESDGRTFYVRTPSLSERMTLQASLRREGARYTPVSHMIRTAIAGMKEIAAMTGEDVADRLARMEEAEAKAKELENERGLLGSAEALEPIQADFDLVERNYDPLGAQVADNMNFDAVYNLALARRFLAGWDGIDAAFRRHPVKGVTDEIMAEAGVVPTDIYRIGMKVHHLMYPPKGDGSGSSSPTSPEAPNGGETSSTTSKDEAATTPPPKEAVSA